MKTVSIVGFGNQAKAWANNLRDSNFQVKIYLQKNSNSIKFATEQGFETVEIETTTIIPSPIILLIPDHHHLDFFIKNQEKILPKGKIVYAHGYSVYKEQLPAKYPQFSHLLLAPKGIATEVRNQYLHKGKLGAAFSLENSLSKDDDSTLIHDLALNIGITAGPYQTTFEMETIADLVSEQTLLCSIIPYTALASYNTLRKSGTPKEIAYMECWYELKLIVDTLAKIGPDKFFDLISPNALIGSEKAKKIFFDDNFFQKIESLKSDIVNGIFFKEVENTDTNALRDQVKQYWKNEELTKVHHDLAENMFDK